MDDFELASALTGATRAEKSNTKPTQTTTISGIATSDSNNGLVSVNLGGDSVTYDGKQDITISTSVSVKKGDHVRITLVGADGTAKDAMVTDVVGGGDRAQESVDEIQRRADSGEFDGVVIYMNSSKGWSFKNNEISTELSIVIYHGSSEIKSYEQLINDFGTGTYLQWSIRKHGDADFTIVSSSDSHLSENSFKYTVSPDDVDVQCVFNVQIITAD